MFKKLKHKILTNIFIYSCAIHVLPPACFNEPIKDPELPRGVTVLAQVSDKNGHLFVIIMYLLQLPLELWSATAGG